MVGTMFSFGGGVLAIIKGETPDDMPVFPMLNEHAAKILKLSELRIL